LAGAYGKFVKKIAILGSTGSIGRQCLAVVESLPERFAIVGLAAGGNLEELVGQIARHRPEVVSVANTGKAAELAEKLRAAGVAPLPAIHCGAEGMMCVGTHAAA
jgi:1-deoxy-D-xylulose-5-phosphate reductoisomerase